MRQVTEDMIQVDKKKCRSCIHLWIQGASGVTACQYVLNTGQRRECPVGWCNKFEPKKRKRKRVSTQIKGKDNDRE